MAVLDSGDAVDAVDRDNTFTGVVCRLVPLEKRWSVGVVDSRSGMIGDEAGVGILDVIVLAKKLSFVCFVFGDTDMVAAETMVVVGQCVVLLLFFPKQQNTLIS